MSCHSSKFSWQNAKDFFSQGNKKRNILHGSHDEGLTILYSMFLSLPLGEYLDEFNSNDCIGEATQHKFMTKTYRNDNLDEKDIIFQ